MSSLPCGSPVLVIIPAHNEQDALPGVIETLRSTGERFDLLVIDDGSTDNTQAILARYDIPTIRIPRRCGVGAAVAAGLRYAKNRGYTTVIRYDGDGQHRADSLQALIWHITHGSTDLVVGCRHTKDRSWDAQRLRCWVNRFLSVFISRVIGHRIVDPTSGLWAFRTKAIALLAEHHPVGFGEPVLHIRARRLGLDITQLPVMMRERQGGSSKLTVIRATFCTFHNICCILREAFQLQRRRRNSSLVAAKTALAANRREPARPLSA